MYNIKDIVNYISLQRQLKGDNQITWMYTVMLIEDQLMPLFN